MKFRFADKLTSAVTLIETHGLSAPPAIAGGEEAIAEAGRHATLLSRPGPVALFTGAGRERSTPVRASLADAGFAVAVEIPVAREPTVDVVDEAAKRVRGADLRLVVAVGGGSVIDAAKAVAALATNPGSVLDYLEGVGNGFTVDRDPLPLLAVPTTAGTGAEMTKNAVIADYDRGFKKSMRDARMIPASVCLDPQLTAGAPRSVTASGGMDAITQLIEPCISGKRTPGATALAHACLGWTRRTLPACCDRPNDLDARGAMLLASAMSGVCLANAGLALVHGIASGMGGLVPVPHGQICGILLPHSLRYNRDACEPELGAALAAWLNEDEANDTTIERGIQGLEDLQRQTGVPQNFTFLNLTDDQVRAVAEHSLGSSLSGNPIPMDAETVYDFLRPLC